MSIFKMNDPSGFFVRTARGFSFVAGLFCLVVSVILISNYVQLASADPLDSSALITLRSLYASDQDNPDLKDQVRAVDLIARKAYFTRRWQLRTAGLLLLGGLAVFFGSLRIVTVLGRRLPVASSRERWRWTATPKTRLVFSFFGVCLILGATVAAILADRTILDTEAIAVVRESWKTLPEEVLSHWVSFRGPGANGVAFDQKPPVEWDIEKGENLLWKVPVPLPGMSSPIVWRNSVFLTGADGDSQEVYRWNADTGELIWAADIGPFPGSPDELPDLEVGAGYAASTGVTDGEYFFAVFASGDLSCISYEGAIVWGSNIGYVDDPYGHSSSLLIFDSILIVQYDHGDAPRIAGFDLATGAVVWQIEREVYDSWASPVLATTSEGMVVVVNGSPYAAAYDPLTGEEIWRVDDIFGEVASSAAYAEGRLVIVNQLMSILGVDANTGELLWELFDDLPDTASPLAYETRALIPTSFGGVTLIKTDTGEVVWRTEFSEGFYASPVLAGDNIYLLDRSGVMRIIRKSDNYELVGSPSIGEPSDSTPAFVKNRIYLRGSDSLFCIGER